MTLEQFKELSLEEMMFHHDGWYMMSDDHSKYEQGVWERNIIEEKVKAEGGWDPFLINMWNNNYNPKMAIKAIYDCGQEN